MSEPRNILVVPEWHPWPEAPVEGSWIRQQTRAIALFNEVATITTRPGPSSWRPSVEVEESVEEGLRTVRVRYAEHPFRGLALRRRLGALRAGVALLRDGGFEPDLIHARVFSAGLPASSLARAAGVPLIVSEHFTGFPRGSMGAWDRLVARAAFRRADLVCPDSADLGEHIARLEPRARIRPMPNVVETDVFRPGPERPPAERRRLLNVASLDDKKGQDHLLRAVAAVRERRPGVELTIMGGGPRRAELEALAETLGIAKAVRFLGPRGRDDVAAEMMDTDVFVLSSLWENAPHVVIEAFACGRRVVATDVGGVSELMDPDAGRLVPAADPDALAAAILAALDDQKPLDTGAVSRRTREAHGLEAVGRLWTAVYSELLGAPQS